jgi:hypothetical protein
MTDFTRLLMCPMAIVWAVFSFSTSPSYCQDAPDSSGTYKQYWVDAQLISIQGNDLESFRNHGAGGVEPTATLILGVSNSARNFDVTIKGSKKEGRFLATVTVRRKKNDSHTAEIEQEMDLSDLKPLALTVGQDDDGRVYRLSLLPRILEHPLPKTFRATDLALENWTFRGSPVILDDQHYLGRLSMTGGPIAWVDIPGLAKIEFSLLPLKGAKPEGELMNETVNITHNNETRIRIANVRNGADAGVLPGGPYHVWVRWMAPSQTIDEYRETIAVQLRAIREQVDAGDLSVPNGTIDRLERASRSDHVLLISAGVRGASARDINDKDQ